MINGSLICLQSSSDKDRLLFRANIRTSLRLYFKLKS